MPLKSAIDRLSRLPRRVKQAIAIIFDMSAGVFAVWLAYSLRLEVWHEPRGLQIWLYAAGGLTFLVPFIRLGLYRAIFRYTGLVAMRSINLALLIHGVLFMIAFWLLYTPGFFPRSVVLTQPIIFGILVVSSRFAARFLFGSPRLPIGERRRVLIYGAGLTGLQTAQSLSQSPEYKVLGFVDDDPKKQGGMLDGKRIYDPGEIDARIAAGGIDEVMLAMRRSRADRMALVNALTGKGIKVTWLPAIDDITTGRVRVLDKRDVDADDLLGRAKVPPDPELMAQAIKGRTVLVTGAAGSIGSELCRQVLGFGASRLILVDHNEFGLYQIENECLTLAKIGDTIPVIQSWLASIRYADRVDTIVGETRPDIIFHAAAYKHVPIVEAHPDEGLETNTFGTLNVARAAIRHGVGRFVLVSTDKAVRPTNIMGATKRLAEMIIQGFGNAETVTFPDGTEYAVRTVFSAVRFGNVLDSSGSVIPLFRDQIEAGGPITVTHPDVTRYFMTIPEASQLVIQAGAMAQGGELFVLDMGEPVAIIDLAQRMVALSGLTLRDESNPNGDIEIVFTGLRPGEKLHEELVIANDTKATRHAKITQALDPAPDIALLKERLGELRSVSCSTEAKRAIFAELAGYTPGSG